MRSRLFCRQTDPGALFAGLRSVESCLGRVARISRSLEARCGPSVTPRGAFFDGEAEVVVRGVVGRLAGVLAEMGGCAEAIESAALDILGSTAERDIRWSAGSQEHYPELLVVDMPALDDGADGAGGASVADPVSIAARYRLQLAATKDRYTSALVTLPWVGPARDEFAGRRLTAVRAGMEAAEDALCLITAVRTGCRH